MAAVMGSARAGAAGVNQYAFGPERHCQGPSVRVRLTYVDRPSHTVTMGVGEESLSSESRLDARDSPPVNKQGRRLES